MHLINFTFSNSDKKKIVVYMSRGESEKGVYK